MRRGVSGKYRVWRLAFVVALLSAGHALAQEKHFLYVAVPGIRNYVEYGGIGILVFDIENGYRFVKRIPTWVVLPGKQPENVKGIAASAETGRLYVSTMNRLAAFDVHAEKKIWDRPYEGGCDRMAISLDGQTLYVPSFEGPFWNVVNAATGDIITKIQTNSGAHNTIASPDGTRVYLAGLHSPMLSVADTRSHKVIQKVGPFANSIRPFTINAKRTLCFVNLNELLGFEVGDLETGKMLYRVEVQGFQKGPVKRHGCPSHGIGGPAIVPGNPGASILMQAVRQDGALTMPPGSKLSAKDIATLAKWIKRGAPWGTKAAR